MANTTTGQELGGADLARTALRVARRTAREAGNAPAKKTTPSRQQIARAGRDAREPSTLAAVLPAMAASQGWALGTAQGAMRGNWAQLVGAEEATHWAPSGFNADTRTLRITCDSPTWATKLRLEQRQLLAKLNHARPDTVRAIDIRVGANTPAETGRAAETSGAGQPQAPRAWAPNGPAAADNPTYQQLRRQMRDQAVARRVALDEATADRAADRDKWFHGHRGWLREPEGTLPATEDIRHQEAADRLHAREQLARHHAALAAARVIRAGALLLRTACPATRRAGAA
ncbi:DciA family protein [Kitasatospora sp. NPDC096077]|uniref:DciA family protein n=1 Tax=Kitasatospora sp. NPDC096077 TaxID=3155544 RepID=UPI00331F085D